MEQSPNSLKPPKPNGKGASKKPMMIGLVIFLIMMLALMYSLTGTRKKSGEEEEKKPQLQEAPLARGQDEGLALPPPPATPAVARVEEEAKPKKNLVVNVGQPPGEDQNQKRREQMYMAALASPMLAKKGQGSGQAESGGSGNGGQNATTTNSIINGGDEGKTSYDPAANIDKENFFRRADTAGDTGAGWLSRYTREAGRELEIKTGTVIPAVLVTGINSDLPGVMIAQVSQNVFDTASGKYLLIPQGAKLYGMYDSRVVYGQERVLVAWNRVIFPDGSSVTLGSMPGADMSGYAGFHDKVNNHYIRAYSNAFLMSIVTGSAAYMVDYFDNSNSSYDAFGNRQPSFGDEIGRAMAQQMSQATIRILEKNLNISPTLEIRPGYQFNVICTKDVAFTEPYSDQFTRPGEGQVTEASHASGTVRP